GDWISGEKKITLDQGTPLKIRMSPNGNEYSVTGPSGTVSGIMDFGAIKPSQAGIYTITLKDGCSSTFEIIVIANTQTCALGSVIPQYKINGFWYSGQSNVGVQPGSEVVLSMLPDGVDVSITLPNGTIVDDEYVLDDFSAENSGTYLLTTVDGCTSEISLTLGAEVENCDTQLITEYRINGEWLHGADEITVNEGSEMIFSMLPNGVDLSITLPDGSVVKDNYKINNFSTAMAGSYVLNSIEGCTKTLNVAVVNECTEDSIIPEYRLDGIWYSGDNEITVDVGTDVMLSMLPKETAFTIRKPDGTIVNDNYSMRNIGKEQEGVYTILTEHGCTETIALTVNSVANCTADSIIPEYRVDGVWKSGQNYLQVAEGSNLLLSMLPNNVGLTIITPDGSEVPDNYGLVDVSKAQSGIYTLISELGCKTTLTLEVTEFGTLKSTAFDQFKEFQVDFEHTSAVNDYVSIYPNPAVNDINIDLQSVIGKSITVRLINMQQQVLVNEFLDKSHESDVKLDVTGLTPGIYVLNLTLEDGEVITQKIIKNQ
ncbi:MAG: T9SS type A sorting domain-containing protein, partial [Flavobacteriaceae bacterium]